MPTPNFHDLSDGSSIVNYAGHDFDDLDDIIFDDPTPTPTPAPPPQPYPPTEINSSPNLNTTIGASHVAANPNRRIEARMFSQGECPPPLAPPSPPRRPRSRRGSSDPDAAMRKDPTAWSLREAVELCKLLEVVVPEAGFHIALTGGLLSKEGRRKDCDLMFYQIRQMEPNYEVLWKYLTVAGVLRSPSYPENGWLVKATYRGKVVDCLFPNAKKVKKVVGKEPAPNQNANQTSPPTPPLDVAGFERSLAELDAERITAAARYVAALTTPSLSSTALCGPETTQVILEAAREIERESERRTGIVDPTAEARARMMDSPIPILYRRSPSAPPPYTREELLATPAPRPTRYDSTREATAHELEATEVYLRERRGLREPEIRSNAEIIDAALLATPAPAPIPPRSPSETTVEAARTLGISVREYERLFE